MPHYRLYILDEARHIRHAHDLDCPDDRSAVSTIREHRFAAPLELWCGSRLVEEITGEPLKEARGDLSRPPAAQRVSKT